MSKKITIDQFKKMVSRPVEDKVIEYTGANGKVFKITVHPLLSINTVMQFVEDAVGIVVNTDSETYIPELLHFAVNRAILTHYADFPMPDSVAEAYIMVSQSAELVEAIVECVDQAQYREITDAIYSTINFRKTDLHSIANQRLIEAAAKLNEIGSRIESTIDIPAITEIAQRFGQLDPDTFAEALTKQLNSLADTGMGE